MTRPVILLLMFLWMGSACAAHGGKDTITVDGVPLELALDVRMSGPDLSLEKRARAKSSSRKPVPFLGLATGAGRWTADVAGIPVSTLSRRSVTGEGDVLVGLTWAADKVQWRLAASGGAAVIRAADLTSLEDSAVRIVADGAGGLEQHVVQTYELGQELDTLPVALSSLLSQQAALGIQIGGRPASRSDWNWWVGATATWMRIQRGPAQVERLPVEGVPEPWTEEDMQRLDWIPPTTWGWAMVVELERRLSPEWSWAIQARWRSGPRGRHGVGISLVRQLVH